ncbi:MAG: aminotransferase class III-fold pyridoxal phosphate-dependent enzyme [Micropruina glycogenica]
MQAGGLGADVPIIVRGKGHLIYDDQGREYIDGLAGLFVVQVGHGRDELARGGRPAGPRAGVLSALELRAPRAIELADRLAAYAPGDLNQVFFTTGGGEAVETAWKLAKQSTGSPAVRVSTR